MAAEVSVTTDPVIVYGMVGVLLGALVLALIFSRPRRDMGAIKRSDVPEGAPTDEPWMPTGDVFGHDAEQVAPPPRPGQRPWPTSASDEGDTPPPWARP